MSIPALSLGRASRASLSQRISHLQRHRARRCHVRFALVIATTIVAAACGGASEASPATTDSTSTLLLGSRDVATVVLAPIAAGITITGSLDAATRVAVKSQIAGQVEQVTVDRGTNVRRGQLLATIDARGANAQAASAEASLAAAERDLRAADTLHKAGAISERDFVQATVARDAAKAQLTLAQVTLGRTRVESPISGIVSGRSVEPGEAVATAADLFTIVNTDALELAGRVAPDAIGGVTVGQPVNLSVDAYSGKTIVGRVARIEPIAESGTRQVTVYVRVLNPRHDLVAGLFATGVILRNGGASNVPVIPATAIAETNGEQAVYVIDGATLSRRVVTIGDRDNERGLVEVRSGLQVGERVLADAPGAIAPGTRVSMADDSSATSAVKRPSAGRAR